MVDRQAHILKDAGSTPAPAPFLSSTSDPFDVSMARTVRSASRTLKDDRAAMGRITTTDANRKEVSS